ncbi:MAG: hypothetical protein ABI594_14870 [Ginsengibacter sp.]
MPDQQNETLENTSVPAFIGLQSYNENQSKFFFGRDEEISELATLVKSNTLTIVFGKSGTGKTSLLNAGVFPKLRADYCLPFRIRLEFKEDSPDLITQIKEKLKVEIIKYGFKAASYPETETLWEYFHKELLWQNVTPILVLDQFEEIFTLATLNPHFTKEYLNNFWEELSNLIENHIPDSLVDQFLNHREQITYNYKRQPVKVIFAFREEFLPEFESIPFKIPSLKYSRFRLMPMNENQAYDVITKTWQEKIDPPQAKEIITYFTNDAKLTYIAEIEPSLLSQVCFYLDKERIAQGKEKITSGFLKDYPKETILRSIYNQVLEESFDAVGRPPAGQNDKIVIVNPVKEFIEDKLITNEGYRTKYALTEKEGNIRPGIEVLERKYFIRDDGKAVEITHDVLAPIIKVDREERRQKVALLEARRKARQKAKVIIIAMVLLGLGFLGYAYYQRNIAMEQEKAAIESTKNLKRQILKDSLRLNGILLAINNNSGNRTSNGNKNLLPKDYPDSLKDSLDIAYKADSVALEDLKEKYDRLTHIVGLQNLQINELKIYQGRLDSIRIASGKLNTEVNDLRSRLFEKSQEVTTLQKRYDSLFQAFNVYKIQWHPPYPKPTEAEKVYTNSLMLDLHFGPSVKNYMQAPGDLTVYIIPDIQANKAVIREAKLYEINCNERKISAAAGAKKAVYANGNYIFPDLPEGNYFIKICTYYGGYYKYVKKTNGNETVNWNASPPIR